MSLARTPLGEVSHQIFNIAYDGSDNPIYIGYAVPGTADNTQNWLIFRFTWVAGNCTQCRVSNGVLDYSAVWDDRAITAYS